MRHDARRRARDTVAVSLGRFLRRSDPDEPETAVTAPSGPGDTETVRRIVRELEALPRDRARFLAAFGYILVRAAAADMEFAEAEMAAVERLVAEHGGLPEAQAVLVAQMARSQSYLYGGTEDYLVTRQFRELSTEEERLALLRCCYVVSSADDTISLDESDTLQEIAVELDLGRADINAIRHEFAAKLSTMKAMLRLREGEPPS